MEQIKIDLVPNGVMSVAHASQFDVGRSMKFLLTDEGVTYTLAGTEVITMKLRKPDGTDDTISLVNTSSSYVEWTTVDGDLDLSGVYLAEITITSGDDVLGTANFLLKVEADPYDGANVRTVTVGPADICTFETTLPEPYQSVLVNVKATGGNGTPDNPNPINGYTEANITRCGVNLVKFTEASYTNSGITCKVHADNSVEVLNTSTATISFMLLEGSIKAGSYILSGCEGGNLGTYAFRIRDKNNTSNYVYSENGDSPVITFAQDTEIQLQLFVYGTTTVNKTFNIMLRKSTSANTFNPYTGNTYTIAFGQTVYGGVLDVTRGKLHVTHVSDLLSNLNWFYYSGNTRFAVKLYDGKPSGSAFGLDTGLCSSYPVVTSQYGSMADNTISVGSNFFSGSTCALVIHDEDYTDANALKTALSGQMIVYELATPFDIDLTPEVISAVVGTNNVFADCGETEVKYLKAGD